MSSAFSVSNKFWDDNAVPILFDVPLDNSRYEFDSIVVVGSEISKIRTADTSFLNGFIKVLQHQQQYDADFENNPSFVVPNIPEYPSIRKLVYSPTGPLDRHYDDVRRFYDAAKNGIIRLLKAGAKRPILAVVLQNDQFTPPDKYKFFDHAAFLGAAEAVYVPLEIRECGPEKAKKVDILGYTANQGNTQNSVLVAVEKGRIACRDIGGSDPERMAAPNVASYVTDLFKNTPVKVEIISDEEVIAREYPLMAAVNRAARSIKRHQGCVIFLTYQPPQPPTKTIMLVGKGVTYDTGGADVKHGGHMAGMHRDKCGAASVAGFLQTVAALQPRNLKVVGALCMVRNSIGPDMYVSDEIVTSRCGVRVRIGNTDAEGRMAMGDVLCHMKEKALLEKDPELFTVATLTGHACMAVGDYYTIIMNNGPAAAANIARNIQAAGDQVGDLFEISTIRREDYEFHKGKSEYEDLLQSNSRPSCETPRGHQCPSAFLIMASGLDKHDINSPSPLKYSHVDIAGSSGPFPGIPTGSTIPAFTFHYLVDK